MTMLQITIPSAPRFRANVTLKNYPKLMEKFAKVSGKARKTAPKAEKRLFPVSGKYWNTKDYVKAYWRINSHTGCEAFFKPLSTRPQEWPQEPLYEVLDEDEGVSNQIDLDGPQSLPAWLTSGIPPAWLKGA